LILLEYFHFIRSQKTNKFAIDHIATYDFPNFGELFMNRITPTKDFILRQKTPQDPLEIWIDYLVTDVVSLSGQNIFQGSFDRETLLIDTGGGFSRALDLDREARDILINQGGVVIFSGPSGVLGRGGFGLVIAGALA